MMKDEDQVLLYPDLNLGLSSFITHTHNIFSARSSNKNKRAVYSVIHTLC